MESLTFATNSETTIHICISRLEEASTEPLVVFLHYWGCSSSAWHKLTSIDSATPTKLTSHPTAAIDLRGWGQSSGPAEDRGDSYSITAMAQDVANVLSQLNEHTRHSTLLENGFILVGHSMGAKVALATIQYLSPSLLNSFKGLVLVAPAPPTALVLPPEMREKQNAAYDSEESIRWTVKNVLSNPENLAESDMDIIIRDSLAGNPLAKAAWPRYGMQEDVSADVKEALKPLVGRVRARVLAGEWDVVETSERVKDQVVRFLEDIGVSTSFTVVKGVKHLIPLEVPEAVSEAISTF
ncbi:alpha/beta fold hydrolase [Aspergillus stella-maris]|uniref:alpha/beta fold hydrolase n=1 Tax=Aspergillus stella-maris TaxID=1810926 RepID=UPI003CCDC08D